MSARFIDASMYHDTFYAIELQYSFKNRDTHIRATFSIFVFGQFHRDSRYIFVNW